MTYTNIDGTVITDLVNLIKEFATLFTVFPINVFLVGSLAGLGFTIFRKAKKTAK